jgi:lipoprotein-anchoring transpeptidase ErfK/SrfK
MQPLLIWSGNCRPGSIGGFVSNGRIRMYNADVPS